MNTSGRKILRPILVLFVIGLIVTLYFLYEFPAALEGSTPLISPEAVDAASPAILKLSITVIATLILGLAYSIISVQASNEKELIEKIVYVDKNKKEGEQAKDEESLEKIDRSKVDEIIAAVKQKKTTQSKYDTVIGELCSKLEASQGILYTVKKVGAKRSLHMSATYAYSLPDSSELSYEFGEGLAGQAAKEAKTMKIKDIPEDYMSIVSGLGKASPKHLIIHPIINDNNVEAVVEIASFKEFSSHDEKVIDEVVKLVGKDLTQKEKKEEEKPVQKTAKSSSKKKTKD